MQFVRNFDIHAGRFEQLPILFRPISLTWSADAPNDCQLLALYSTDEFIPWIFALYDMNRRDGISNSFHFLAHSGNIALFGQGLRKGRYEDHDRMLPPLPDGGRNAESEEPGPSPD